MVLCRCGNFKTRNDVFTCQQWQAIRQSRWQCLYEKWTNTRNEDSLISAEHLHYIYPLQLYISVTGVQQSYTVPTNAWIAFVYIHSDRFANEIRVKGKQAFIGVNQNIINAGDPAAIHPRWRLFHL